MAAYDECKGQFWSAIQQSVFPCDCVRIRFKVFVASLQYA